MAVLLCVIAAAGAAPAASASASHPAAQVPPYPYKNPLIATVLGTPPKLRARLPSHVHVVLHRLKPLVQRATPATLRYARPLQYTLAAQHHPAPLAFVIAGTGDSALSNKCVELSRALYAVGYSVVCLPSPTSVTFMLGAARYPVPGRMPTDVDDLYRMMVAVQDKLSKKLHITGYVLTGWSLGATEAAFVDRKDADVGRFHFSRVLLLNPAVSVWASVKRMDRLLQDNLPGGMSQLPDFLANTLGQLKRIYASDQALRFNEDSLFKSIREAVPQNRHDMGAIIGLAFRLSLANMSYAADLLTHAGLIVPRNVQPGPYASLGPYFERAMQLSFTDYINELLVPYWNRDGRHVSKRQLIAEADMHRIAPFLASHANIAVFSNADDPILGPGGIAFLRRTFGDRARIRPHGGHLGNLDYKPTMHAIETYFAP